MRSFLIAVFVLACVLCLSHDAQAIGGRSVVKQANVSRGRVQKQVVVQKNVVAPLKVQRVVQVQQVRQHLVQPLVVQRVIAQPVYGQVIQQLNAGCSQQLNSGYSQQLNAGCNLLGH